MKLVLVGLLAATAFASPGFAQEVNPSFTGPRIELLGGYDRLGVDSEDEDGEDSSDSASNVLYGGGVGFDFAFGGVVVGIEGEYTKVFQDSQLGDDDEPGETIEGFDVTNTSLKSGRDLYVGGRVGFLLSPSTMVYGKAGYINSSLKVGAIADDGEETFDIRERIKFDGWRIGGGVEFAFPQGFFGKVEYRYSKYSDGEFSANGDDIDIGDAFDSFDLDRHQVVFGLGIRF